jgi:hypothetical protein
MHVKETNEDLKPTFTALYSTFKMLPWQTETALERFYKDLRVFIEIQIGPNTLL